RELNTLMGFFQVGEQSRAVASTKTETRKPTAKADAAKPTASTKPAAVKPAAKAAPAQRSHLAKLHSKQTQAATPAPSATAATNGTSGEDWAEF
ncbi:hypothetical protein, partial [Magnetospirillum aberrantis]|nr:hypothetical protein [Magnetospirillum aberrantis SpK]